MSDLITKLRDQRLSAWEAAKGIAEKAAEEGRAFSADEQQSWQRANDDIDAIDKRMTDLLDAEKRSEEANKAFAELEKRQASREVKPQTEKGESDELRKFLTGESRARSFDVAPQGEFRNLLKGTATAGGNTVPTTFYDRLIQHLIVNAAILQAGPTVLNTSSGENIDVPKTTAHPTASRVAEAATLPNSEPTFGKVTLGAYKYGDLIYISRELLADTAVDLEGYLSMAAGRALGNAFGTDAVVGTGSSQPNGIVTAATLGVTGGTGVAGVFTADNLIDLYYSVIAPYRANPSCHWFLNDASMATVRKFKSTTNEYIWQPSYVAGAPDTILGKPVLTDPNVATTAVSAKSVLFGDFSAYFVRLAGAVRFERSDDFKFDSDLVTFRAIMRADGNLVDQTGAVKFFAGAAT